MHYPLDLGPNLDLDLILDHPRSRHINRHPTGSRVLAPLCIIQWDSGWSGGNREGMFSRSLDYGGRPALLVEYPTAKPFMEMVAVRRDLRTGRPSRNLGQPQGLCPTPRC